MSDKKKTWRHRDHHANPPEQKMTASWRRAHKDWRVWLAVALMLLAMLVYLMTMDESIQPGGKLQDPAPAAPAL